MIIRTRGQEVERRSFSLTDMAPYGWTDVRSGMWAQQQATNKTIRGIPAVSRAVRIRAEAIANLRLCCYRGYGAQREKVDTVWQSALFDQPRYNEYQTRFAFWESVEESLCYRSKAYIWKNVDPVTGRVVEWFALHPDQVKCEGGDEFTVQVTDEFVDPVGRGRATYEVNDDTILYIRGHGEGGKYDPPTPIQVYKETFNSNLARIHHETRMWTKGTALRLAVTFPQGVTQDQAEQWREKWKQTYEGAGGETTAIIGGGATLAPISMTAEDAQFVELAHLSAEDAARIMGVPPRLLGIFVDKNIPLEQDLAEWLRFGIGPELGRIEMALGADEQLFGAARTRPEFETDHFVRGDIQTEAAILVQLVQAGILLPDEARAVRGLDELPGGVGAIPQVTPVGGAPNPTPQPYQQPPPDESGD